MEISDLITDFIKRCHELVDKEEQIIEGLDFKYNAKTGELDFNLTESAPIKIQCDIEEKKLGQTQKYQQIINTISEVKKLLLRDEWKLSREKIEFGLSLSKELELSSYLEIFTHLYDYTTYKWEGENLYIKKLSHLANDSFSLTVPFDTLPQNIFTVNLKNKNIIGFKGISKRWMDESIDDIFCNLISQDMILGFTENMQIFDDKVCIFFRMIDRHERIKFFENIKKDNAAAIDFPFAYRNKINLKEVSTDPMGWRLNHVSLLSLRKGEVLLREYVRDQLHAEQLEGKIVYDPACSSGDFLASIKAINPSCYTIGQDLSKEMTLFAKTKVDRVIHGNAIESPLEEESVDLCMVRFLNSEVVSSEEAYKLFAKIIKRLKINGELFMFGMTPVLINSSWLKNSGHKIVSLKGFEKKYCSVFQFYHIIREY